MPKGHRRVWLSVLAALLVSAAVAGCSREPSLAVQIVFPAEGATVPAGEGITLEVEITGGHIQGRAGEGRPGHIHLYVDRQLVEMNSEDRPTVTLEPGRHLLMVEFAGESHESLGVTDQVEVTAE